MERCNKSNINSNKRCGKSLLKCPKHGCQVNTRFVSENVCQSNFINISSGNSDQEINAEEKMCCCNDRIHFVEGDGIMISIEKDEGINVTIGATGALQGGNLIVGGISTIGGYIELGDGAGPQEGCSGSGIISVQSNSLIFTDSDGNNVDIGSGVTGPQGSQGLHGGARGVQGSLGFTGDLGHQGHQGQQGFQGMQGIQGFQGGNGITGIQGEKGEHIVGSQGSIGFQGVTGMLGAQGDLIFGPQGEDGFHGVTGPQGFQGSQGTTGNGPLGDQGVTGARGIIGSQGVTGFQGLEGTRGVTGFQGVTGIQGIQGSQGFQGTMGIRGFQGLTGAFGVTGPIGQTGYQGYQGHTGNQGFQGVTGSQGATGFLGSPGFQGSTGSQGYQGITGTEGSSGDVGFRGPQGFQGDGFEIVSCYTGATEQSQTSSSLPYNLILNTYENSSFEICGSIDLNGTTQQIYQNFKNTDTTVIQLDGSRLGWTGEIVQEKTAGLWNCNLYVGKPHNLYSFGGKVGAKSLNSDIELLLNNSIPQDPLGGTTGTFDPVTVNICGQFNIP